MQLYDRDDEDDLDQFDDDLLDYDDNDRELAYARLLQRQGVQCTCEYCGGGFIGMPSHGVCGRCADMVEAGYDLG